MQTFKDRNIPMLKPTTVIFTQLLQKRLNENHQTEFNCKYLLCSATPPAPGFKASIKKYFWIKSLFLLHIAARISQLTKVHSLVAFSQCCSTCRVRKLDKTKLLSENTTILSNYSAKICQLALGGLCCLRVAFFVEQRR